MPPNFRAAEGYFDLGLYQEAWDELEAMPPAERAAPEVILLRIHIYVAMERWEPAAMLARSLANKGETEPDLFITGAYAIRRAETLEAARAFLTRGTEWMQEVWEYHFNLACYECQLGNRYEAKQALGMAQAINRGVSKLALAEPDLAPLFLGMATKWPPEDEKQRPTDRGTGR